MVLVQTQTHQPMEQNGNLQNKMEHLQSSDFPQGQQKQAMEKGPPIQ